MPVNIAPCPAKRALLIPERGALVCDGSCRAFAECKSRANEFAPAAKKPREQDNR